MSSSRLFSGDEMLELTPKELAELVRKSFAALPREQILSSAQKLHPRIQERIFKKPEFAREVLRVSARQDKSFRTATSLGDFIAKLEATVQFRDRTRGRGGLEKFLDEPLPQDVYVSSNSLDDPFPRYVQRAATEQKGREYTTLYGVRVCVEDVIEASRDRAKLEKLTVSISLLKKEDVALITTPNLVRMMTNMIRSLIEMGVR